VVEFIDANCDCFGVEPICEVLLIAPSTYYAVKSRPPSTRSIREEELKPEVERVNSESYGGCYGARKVWRQLGREGFDVARCTERLMRELGISSVKRGGYKVTTVSDDRADRPKTWCGGSQVRSDTPRRAVGRRHHLRGDVSRLRLRRVRDRPVLPHDRGLASVELASQRPRARSGGDGGARRGRCPRRDSRQRPRSAVPSIRCTGRLSEAGAVASVGSKGDSYDDALAETINGLHKTEVIRRKGP